MLAFILLFTVTVTARAPGILSISRQEEEGSRRTSSFPLPSVTFIKNQISLPEFALTQCILLLMSDWSLLGYMTNPTCKGGQENKYVLFQTVMGGGKGWG